MALTSHTEPLHKILLLCCWVACGCGISCVPAAVLTSHKRFVVYRIYNRGTPTEQCLQDGTRVHVPRVEGSCHEDPCHCSNSRFLFLAVSRVFRVSRSHKSQSKELKEVVMKNLAIVLTLVSLAVYVLYPCFNNVHVGFLV